MKIVGYKDKNGLVGQYQGNNVYVIDYEKLSPPDEDDKTWYAVRRRGVQDLELVLGDFMIGTMSDSGHIVVFDRSRRAAYKFYTVPKKVNKPKYIMKQTEPIADPDPSALALDVEFGYGEYSKIVDNFFKGLDKLWEEIDSSLKR